MDTPDRITVTLCPRCNELVFVTKGALDRHLRWLDLIWTSCAAAGRIVPEAACETYQKVPRG